MYVGHNPAAQELAAGLLGRAEVLPTAAIAVIGLSVPWVGLDAGDGELVSL